MILLGETPMLVKVLIDAPDAANHVVIRTPSGHYASVHVNELTTDLSKLFTTKVEVVQGGPLAFLVSSVGPVAIPDGVDRGPSWAAGNTRFTWFHCREAV